MQFFESKTRKKLNILHSLPDVPILALCRGGYRVNRDFSKVKQKSPKWWLKNGRKGEVLGLYLPFITSRFWVCIFRKRKTSSHGVMDHLYFTGHGAIAPLCSGVWGATNADLTAFSPPKAYHQSPGSLIHPGSIQQTFQHVFNRGTWFVFWLLWTVWAGWNWNHS